MPKGGGIFVTDYNNREYLLADTDIDSNKVEEKSRKQPLFIIQERNGQNLPEISFKKYEKLIQNFFTKNNQKGNLPKRCRKKYQIWSHRFRETVANINDMSVKHDQLQKKFINNSGYLYAGKKYMECDWAFATYKENNTFKWIMPIFSPKLRNSLEEHDSGKFIPTNFFMEEEAAYGKHCFFTPHKRWSTPQLLECVITRQTVVDEEPSEKNITLINNGFLHPAVMHYKFWKHGLGKIQKNNKEAEIWKEICEINQKPPSLSLSCYEKPESFRYSKSSDFNKHHNILKENKLDCYLNIVHQTFENPVKIFLYETEVINNIHYCIVAILGNNINVQDNTRIYNPCLILHGTCFNWDCEHPKVHLYIKTCYLKEVNYYINGIRNESRKNLQKMCSTRNPVDWEMEGLRDG